MTITKKSGMEIKAATMADFNEIADLHKRDVNETGFTIRKGKVLIEETLEVLPSLVAIAMVHREMDDAQRAGAIGALRPTRTYKMVQIGKDVEGLTVGSEPMLDWDNAMSIKRININGLDTNLIRLSATFAALPYNLRTRLIEANKPITIKEYLLVADYVILGSYK